MGINTAMDTATLALAPATPAAAAIDKARGESFAYYESNNGGDTNSDMNKGKGTGWTSTL